MDRPDPANVSASIRWHRAQPHVRLDDHVRRKRIELGESLAQRHAVYLDTRYWIHLRDAQLGRTIGVEYLDLLAEVRGAVNEARRAWPRAGVPRPSSCRGPCCTAAIWIFRLRV